MRWISLSAKRLQSVRYKPRNIHTVSHRAVTDARRAKAYLKMEPQEVLGYVVCCDIHGSSGL